MASTATAGSRRLTGASVPPLVGALLALTAGLSLPVFRDPEGFLTGDVALPLGAAAAALALAVTRRPGWRDAGGWMALALLGQGAALSLVDAGPMVRYQHLWQGAELVAGVRSLAVAVLVLQGLLLAGRARGVVAGALRVARARLGALGSLAVLGAFGITSATLSRELAAYGTELVLATGIQALQAATVLMAAARSPGAPWTPSDEGPRDRLPWLLAAWTVGVSAVLAWFAYQRHVHVPDEVVYLLHARYFAQGLLELPLPPVLAGFDLDLMTVDPDRWFSPVPPGWPAALAVGVALGAPWLVNPVLGGLCVLLTPRVVEAVYGDRRVARTATVLLATSPWFLFMCMNYMTHTLTFAAALTAAWAAGTVVRGGHEAWLVPGGLAIGVVALIRPLEGLIVAGTLGPWVLMSGGVPLGRRVVRTGVLAVGSFVGTAVVFPYNRHFTGRATHFPIMDYTDRVYGVGTNAMGFGPEKGLGWPGLDPFPGHGAIDVLVNGNLNLYQVNVELLGWSVGSILILALLLFGGRMRRGDWMMLWPVALVVGAHAFYWFSGGPDFGARYWYLILLPCLALAARGLQEVAGDEMGGPRSWTAAAVLVAGAVLVFVPWRAVDKYHHYRNMRPDVRVLAEERGFGDALVLVRGDRHPDYASAAIYNPLDLRGAGPIYAWDRSAEVRAAVLEAYPDRPVWVVDGPTVTGGGFEVVQGPVTDRTRLLPAPTPASGGSPP